MPEEQQVKTGFFDFLRRKPEVLVPPWEALRNQELAAGLAVLEERRRNERLKRRAVWIFQMWPVGVGLVMAAFVPVIKLFAETMGPWAMTLVFPFAVLAKRPEMQVGPITHQLPVIMLYLQFPIEGLLARLILKPTVRLTSVIVQVLLFHILGIMEVWMLNGWHRL